MNQLNDKVKSIPELHKEVLDYNGYLMESFQDSHRVYYQTIVPHPTFYENVNNIRKDCTTRFESMLKAHFENQYDYNLHLPPSQQPNEKLIIIQATFTTSAFYI